MTLNRPVRAWLAAGALAAISAVGFLPGVASAAPAPTTTTTTTPGCYPISVSCGTDANSDGMSLSKTTVKPGGDVTVFVTDGSFDPDATLDAVIHSTPLDLGHFTANAQGGATFSVTIPNDLEAGTHTISVSGLKDSTTVTISEVLQVSASSTTSTPSTKSSSLPRTGSDVVLPAAGIGALMVGGGLVLKRSSKKSKA